MDSNLGTVSSNCSIRFVFSASVGQILSNITGKFTGTIHNIHWYMYVHAHLLTQHLQSRQASPMWSSTVNFSSNKLSLYNVHACIMKASCAQCLCIHVHITFYIFVTHLALTLHSRSNNLILPLPLTDVGQKYCPTIHHGVVSHFEGKGEVPSSRSAVGGGGSGMTTLV